MTGKQRLVVGDGQKHPASGFSKNATKTEIGQNKRNALSHFHHLFCTERLFILLSDSSTSFSLAQGCPLRRFVHSTGTRSMSEHSTKASGRSIRVTRTLPTSTTAQWTSFALPSRLSTIWGRHVRPFSPLLKAIITVFSRRTSNTEQSLFT